MSRCTCTRGASVVTDVTYEVLHPFQHLPRVRATYAGPKPSGTGRDAYRGPLVPTSDQSTSLLVKPQRPAYGRSAISRAFLIARASSCCCWAVTRVTRRLRILPRSVM